MSIKSVDMLLSLDELERDLRVPFTVGSDGVPRVWPTDEWGLEAETDMPLETFFFHIASACIDAVSLTRISCTSFFKAAISASNFSVFFAALQARPHEVSEVRDRRQPLTTPKCFFGPTCQGHANGAMQARDAKLEKTSETVLLMEG